MMAPKPTLISATTSDSPAGMPKGRQHHHGKIYQDIITKERRGDYLGGTCR